MKNSLLVILGSLGILGFYFWMKNSYQAAPEKKPLRPIYPPLAVDQYQEPEQEPVIESFTCFLWGDNGRVVLSITPEIEEAFNINNRDSLQIIEGLEEAYPNPIAIVTKSRGIFPDPHDIRQACNLFTDTAFNHHLGTKEVTAIKVEC